MRPTILVRTTLAVVLVLCGVGALEAALGDEWDLVALFGAAAVPTTVLLVGTWGARQHVLVRSDLAQWIRSRAAVTGERPGDLADRAVAAYRDGLTGEDRDEDRDGHAHRGR